MVRYLTSLFLLTLAFSSFGQSSVLKSGKWYKIAVEKTGVYKLTLDHFKKMGLDPSGFSPDNIRVFGQGGGMLPQANNVARPSDLVEISIMIEGAEDGIFDQSDYALFYGEGPHENSFVPGKNVFHTETNLFSDKNFYFVTLSDEKGMRMNALPAGSGGVAINEFHDYVQHEFEDLNVLHSGREWFGENFELTPEHSFEFTIPGIVANSEMKIVSEVMAQSYKSSSFRIFFNDQQIGEQVVPVIPNSQYGAKGRIKRDTIAFNASAVSAPQATSQHLRYNFVNASSGRSAGYLNHFSIHCLRQLSLYDDQTLFRNGASSGNNCRYQISNVPENGMVWNVTDPFTPKHQQTELSENGVSFSSGASVVEEFVVFNRNIPEPELIGEISNQDIHGLTTPNLLIVTHPDFLAEANRLASHRIQHNHLSVAVVTTEEVYNEFSSGRQDVTAIRDAAKFLHDKNPSTLTSLLLFGKCSYDYKDRVQTNYNFVPSYESRNSLSPLETFASDDYFAFLETHEGEWEENGSIDDHTLDIGVGRLPVKSIEEARTVVDKLIAYDTDTQRFGKWRKDVAFVADDGSNSDGFTSIHQAQANSLADDIESLHPAFNTRKIFLGTYAKKVSPNGEAIPKANEDITEEFHQSVIINYTGHGSEKLWADERVLTPEDISELKNRIFPFLVTATCEFGRHDDPSEISSAELTVLKEKGGSIGLVTTTRPVNSSTNFSLNLAFYEALFQQQTEGLLTIGEIYRRTKNNSMSGVSNRNFSLLGDPSMTLALPLQSIKVDYIKTEAGSDTLKALSKVTVKGRIVLSNGETDTEFTGTVQATLFDKRTEFQTIGKNDPAFQYEQWFNPLYRGQSSVKNGSFESSFILPKNIAYEVNPGKLSLYALDPSHEKDAAGSSSDFKIGQSETDPPPDNDSPLLQVFMGDSTFINGGAVSPNSTLVVRISDKSGINISNYGIGNTMMAVLDEDSEVYLINEYFLADTDDFTTGWVHFPVYNLAPGRHKFTVKVWDTYNNPAQQSIEFVVTEGKSFIIEAFGNYPNPFQDETTLFFRHNRPGDDLESELILLNAAGIEIKSFHFSIPFSSYQVDLLKFNVSDDLGKKLSSGLYFARLTVRSLSDGAESTGVTKLILAN